MIKKFLQKLFKKISYSIFFKIYGKIENSIGSESDNRIKVEVFVAEKNLNYRIYKITNGRLYTDRIQDTAVILDKKIISEPSFQFRRSHDGKIYVGKINDNIVFKKGTPRILKNLKGRTLSLLTGGGGNNNYWHWLTDVLPRFGLCSEKINLKEIDFFLLPSLEKKFQNETLDCLNIPKHKRLSSEKFRHIKARELIVTDHPVVTTGNATHDSQNIPRWIIYWLKNNLINKNLITENKIKNKIYIDRNDSKSNGIPQRMISNESEVKKYLLEKNFVAVNLDNMKFHEQVDLFYNAECIAGLHGSGFVNLAFCKPGTKVIEFRSYNAGPIIENFAKKNDLNYNSIITESKEIYKLNHPNQQGSIKISINSLRKILES